MSLETINKSHIFFAAFFPITRCTDKTCPVKSIQPLSIWRRFKTRLGSSIITHVAEEKAAVQCPDSNCLAELKLNYFRDEGHIGGLKLSLSRLLKYSLVELSHCDVYNCQCIRNLIGNIVAFISVRVSKWCCCIYQFGMTFCMIALVSS